MARTNKCGTYSDLECSIIMEQIQRRAKYREEFLKRRTDPCKHSKEAGYVHDDAMQRFFSMKCTQFDHFKPTFKNILTGIGTLVPMFIFGFVVYHERAAREKLIRCGEISYKNRLFKLQ